MSFTFTTLKTAIQEYMDNDESTFTSNLTNFIVQAENRVFNTIELNVFRKNVTGTATSGNQYLGAPSDFISPMSLAVLDSDSKYTYLLLKHVSFMRNYIDTAATTGVPKYYAQFGGATGTTDTTSGKYMFAPVPDSTYKFQVHFNAMPTSLVTNTSGTYISKNFPNGLLYACLIEAYGYLKGPMDMLTFYEQKYNNVVQKFAAEQIGRRRRDDYTDGTIRIPIESPNP